MPMKKQSSGSAEALRPIETIRFRASGFLASAFALVAIAAAGVAGPAYPLRIAVFALGGQDIGIVLFQPHGGRSQTEGDALTALMTQGSLQAAIFNSDDLDTTFEKVRASGAEVLQEPTSQPWGARDCAFRDPSGNLVRIAQS